MCLWEDASHGLRGLRVNKPALTEVKHGTKSARVQDIGAHVGGEEGAGNRGAFGSSFSPHHLGHHGLPPAPGL